MLSMVANDFSGLPVKVSDKQIGTSDIIKRGHIVCVLWGKHDQELYGSIHFKDWMEKSSIIKKKLKIHKGEESYLFCQLVIYILFRKA